MKRTSQVIVLFASIAASSSGFSQAPGNLNDNQWADTVKTANPADLRAIQQNPEKFNHQKVVVVGRIGNVQMGDRKSFVIQQVYQPKSKDFLKGKGFNWDDWLGVTQQGDQPAMEVLFGDWYTNCAATAAGRDRIRLLSTKGEAYLTGPFNQERFALIGVVWLYGDTFQPYLELIDFRPPQPTQTGGSVEPSDENATKSQNCLNNLKQIGLAFRIWEGDNGDRFPFNVSTNRGGTMELCQRGSDGYEMNGAPHFQVMSNELNTPKILLCPADSAALTAAVFDGHLKSWNVSYLVRSGSNIDETNPQEALAACPIHGHTVYCDGSVRRGGDATPRSLQSGEQALHECLNNLRLINRAIERWASDNNKHVGDNVDIAEMQKFLPGGRIPDCPSGGRYFSAGVGKPPVCSIPTHSLSGATNPQAGGATTETRVDLGVVCSKGKIGDFKHGTKCTGYYEASAPEAKLRLIDIQLVGKDSTKPYTKTKSLVHPGVDIVAAEGSEIFSVADGVVDDVILNSNDADFASLGYAVAVQHDKKIDGKPTYSLYLHMKEKPKVQVGQAVKAGQITLGFVGSTGAAFGPHVHFEIRHFAGWFFPKWKNIYGIERPTDEATFSESEFLANWVNPENAISSKAVVDGKNGAGASQSIPATEQSGPADVAPRGTPETKTADVPSSHALFTKLLADNADAPFFKEVTSTLSHSYDDVWSSVEQVLRGQKEKVATSDKARGILTTELTSHWIVMATNFRQYYILLERAGDNLTKITYKVLLFHDQPGTTSLLRATEAGFVERENRKFIDQIEKKLNAKKTAAR